MTSRVTSDKKHRSLGVGLLEHPVELVEMPVRWLALHGGAEAGQSGGVVEPRRLSTRLPDLQVRLPVQVGGLDERYALRFTGGMESLREFYPTASV